MAARIRRVEADQHGIPVSVYHEYHRQGSTDIWTHEYTGYCTYCPPVADRQARLHALRASAATLLGHTTGVRVALVDPRTPSLMEVAH
jgi:hypothetical protein